MNFRQSPCPPEVSYLSSSDFTSNAFHILTCCEVPIHLITVYVILTKTPAKMKSVKWVMFNLHLWSALLDISLSFLVTPYILFPVAAGWSHGALRWLGVGSGPQLTLIVIEIGFTIMSNIVLFENRYTIIASSPRIWIRVRKMGICFGYLFAFFYFFPFLTMVPDQETVMNFVVKKIPSVRCFYPGPIYVFTLDHGLVLGVTAAKVLTEFGCIIILVVCTFISLLDQMKKATMSKTTLSIQRKFFLGIIVQTSIPVVILVFPLFYFFITLLWDTYSQALNNISFLTISCHGFFSTLAMLAIHQPYRHALFRCGKRDARMRTASISTHAHHSWRSHS